MQFLNYTGDYKKISSKVYRFDFDDNIETESPPLFIVPPIYDISFKKIFSFKKIGLESARDLLNSLFFPKSQSIIELKCVEKEILSNSHLKNDEGTRIVDNAFIAKIRYYEKDKEKTIVKEKEVLIDFEMESNYQIDKYTSKFFNYATGLRNQNDFLETWVIALCVNRSKKPRDEKSSKSYMTKKYKFNDKSCNKDLDYVKIYEVYLNDLYSKLNESISIFENEEIQEIGKEWIKLFTIELWANGENDLFYCIPSNLKFKGKYIERAIEILSDIHGESSLRINVEKHHQKEVEENLEKQFKQIYQDGFNDANLKLLDTYFQMHLNGEELGKIILAGKISSSLLKERYGASQNVQSFYELLSSKNLIIN